MERVLLINSSSSFFWVRSRRSSEN